MTWLVRGEAVLQVFDKGRGFPIVFQHGLGGDQGQVARNLPPEMEARILTVECRGHGGSSAGDVRPFSIKVFAEDVLAAIDAVGIDRFVIGGISMGAAIALRIAAHHPDRVAGLALVRPAWLFEPAPQTMRPYAEVAAALRDHPPEEARAVFGCSATARHLAEHAPDNLASLLGFFDHPDRALTAHLLADIAADGPGVSAERAAAIGVRTVAIGCAEDEVHPLSYAKTLATVMRGAFIEVAAKARAPARHFAEVGSAIGEFFETLDIKTGGG
jgi:pimeloyl-ACP methyl ester carboxylesterase